MGLVALYNVLTTSSATIQALVTHTQQQTVYKHSNSHTQQVEQAATVNLTNKQHSTIQFNQQQQQQQQQQGDQSLQ